ncbi:MAG: Gfo/Idh/MocA family oxidoreductase [Candidatus Eisenbacteria bacterium]
MSRIRVAILGTSFGRLVQVPGFQRHPGFELVAIAGRDAAKTERIAHELGIPKGYGDWRELLEREQPQLVSIVTPVDLHHDMMLAAIQAGAHVHCEKPTALHRWQAIAMRDAALAAGRVAGINHEFRFFPARAHALDLVKRGAIGRPRRAEILGRYPIWARADSRPFTWLADATRGGGILGALGSHHTDCVRTFFGEPASVLASVRTDQPRRGNERATADDACTIHYEFAGGASALIDLSAAVPYRWERFEVHGEEASLRWDETGYTLWRIDAGKDPVELPIPAEHMLAPREGDPALVAPFGVMVERLHRAITTGEPLTPSFAADAVPVQCALDACRASSVAGTRVVVEPAPEPALTRA